MELDKFIAFFIFLPWWTVLGKQKIEKGPTLYYSIVSCLGKLEKVGKYTRLAMVPNSGIITIAIL